MTQHLKILQDMQEALDDAYAAGIRNSKREWVGLNQIEVRQIFQTMFDAEANWPSFADAIEAKLKEKNT